MHSVQFQLEFENNTINQEYPKSFVKKLSFDEMQSPVYGLMEEQSDDFEIERMLMGKNKIPSDPQSQNFCFRKLQFDIGDDTDDLFFSTPDTCNTEKATGSATEFITSCETLEVSDFTLHCGPQETPCRNPRDYSLSKRIGRGETCGEDLLVSISRTDSDDIFKAYEHPRASMGGSPMYVESDDVVECTPTKFLPTSKNSLRNRGQNAITPQTLVDFVSNAQNQSYLIVDCRYDYEYNGGHIKGAINVETPAALETLFVTYKHLLFNRESLENIKENFGILQSHPHLLNSLVTNPNDYCVPVIIFHCEFSQKRGPRALRMLREIDRQLNYNDFPNLYYPEVYILEGGYSNFYRQFPEHCSENNYIKMVDERYKSHYQQARQKEKRCWEVKPSFGKLLNLQRSKTMNFL